MIDSDDDNIVSRVENAEPFGDGEVAPAADPANVVDLAAHRAAQNGPQASAENSGGKNGGKPPSRRKGDGEVAPPNDDDDDGGMIGRMNDEWAFCILGSRAVVMRERSDGPIEDRLKFLSIDAFRAYYQNARVRISREVKDEETGEYVTKHVYYQRAPWWLKHRQRRTYDGIEFFPNPDGAKATDRYLNLWRGFSVVPMPDSECAPAERWRRYAIFRDHVLTNVCSGNKEYFDWLFAWMAHIVQKPRERPGTAIVMRGLRGTGKSKVGEVLGSLFRAHYFQVDDARYVTGQFNAHMASCIVLQADEAVWAGDKAAEGRLKGLITAAFQMIEAKGIDPIRVANFVRLMMTSNEDWVVPAGMDERRYAVFDVASHVKENREYFKALDEELDNGGRRAFLADLLSLDLDKAPSVHAAPKTAALLEQKMRSFDPVTAWLYQRLLDGSMTRRSSHWTDTVAIDTVHGDYLRWAEKQGQRRRHNEIEFSLAVRRTIPGILRKRKFIDIEEHDDAGFSMTVRRRKWCWELPKIEDARAAFEAALYQTIDWGAAGDESDSVSPDTGGSDVDLS